MDPVSFALGRWRAEQRKPIRVPLAQSICAESYVEGFNFGVARREHAASARRTSRAA